MELVSPLVRLVCYHLNVLVYLQSEVYKNSVATSVLAISTYDTSLMTNKALPVTTENV